MQSGCRSAARRWLAYQHGSRSSCHFVVIYIDVFSVGKVITSIDNDVWFNGFML